MKPLTSALVAFNLAFVMLYTLWYVSGKEQILSDGELLLFELAPADPRSLIQGDYMRLAYAISRELSQDTALQATEGFLVVRPDISGVAKHVRTQPAPQPLGANEYAIAFRVGKWRTRIGAESYFFQEGTAVAYEAAAYGGLRVDRAGNSILVGLYDEDRKLIP